MLVYSCDDTKIDVVDAEEHYNVYAEAAFLLLKKYDVIYKENLARFGKNPDKAVYAIPYKETPALSYFGTDRVSELTFKENLTFENLLTA